MRKNHFLAAAGAMSLLLASCASDEPVANVNNTPENLISYSAGISNQTRAFNSYCASIMPESFNVWAHIDNDDNTLYISGDLINKSGDSYVAAVDRYWPEDDETLSFYAYADAENTFKYNNGAPKFENYTIKDDVAEQLDLMYAVTKEVANKQTVNLNFRHALAQVCYKAANENPNLTVTINKITVAGLANQGTYTFPTESTATNYESHAGAEPVEELNRGTWVLDADRSASYEVNVGGVKLSDEVSNLTFPELDEDNTHSATDFSKVLALLPYDNENATTAATVGSNMTARPTDGTYFILNLTVENIATDENGEEVTYPLLDKKDFYVGAAFDWEQGNRYTYTFKFGADWTPDNLEPIAYAISVDDYINRDGGEIENPTHWTDPFSIPKKVLMVEATEDRPAIYIADRNLGATTSFDISDETLNFGEYYAWGNLTGTTKTLKEDFDAMGWTGFSNNNWDQFMSYDIFDESGNLKPEYDAATNALGEGWHIPTKEEWENFLEGTTYRVFNYTTGSGSYVVFTSKTTGNTVSLPCPGYLGSGGYITRVGESGEYMSSTPKKPEVGTVTSAYGLNISTPNRSVTIGTVSVHGEPASIRPFYTAPAK